VGSLQTAPPVGSFAGGGFELLTEIAAAAVFVLIVIAVVVVIALAILRAPPLRRRIRSRTQRWSEVPGWLSWLAGTALHMDKFSASPEVGDPEAVATMLGAQLSGAGARRPLAGVDLATTPYRTSSVLDDIAETVKGLPNGQVLAALIKLGQKLLPRSDLYVRGYLLSSPERGAGLVLSIVSDAGQVASSGTLWADVLEPYANPMGADLGAWQATDDGTDQGTNHGAQQQADPNPPLNANHGVNAVAPQKASVARPQGDVLRLAIAGAVWVQFQLLEEIGQADLSTVRNWRSASLFEVAVHDEGSRDSRGLRALYALALDRDPGNLPALFNLAVLELHAGYTTLACARLRTILDALHQEHHQAAAQGGATGAGAEKHDPLFYQAHYTLAVALQTLQLEQAQAEALATNGHPAPAAAPTTLDDTTLDDTTLNNTTLNDTTLNNTTLNNTTLNDTTLNNTTLNDTTLDNTTLENTTPDDTTPDDATPDDATPDGTTPAHPATTPDDPAPAGATVTQVTATQSTALADPPASSFADSRAQAIDEEGLAHLYQVACALERDISRTLEEAKPHADGSADSAGEARARRDAKARLQTLRRIEGPYLVMLAIRRQSGPGEARFERVGDAGAGARLAAGPFTREQVVSTLKAWEKDEEPSDAQLNPQTLAFGYIHGESPEVSYRTHYNRACYATLVAQKLATQEAAAPTEQARIEMERERGEALDWAIAKLECALEPGDLVEWATLDLSLCYLREQRATELDAVLRRYTPGG
jgi:hypothetical protein